MCCIINFLLLSNICIQNRFVFSKERKKTHTLLLHHRVTSIRWRRSQTHTHQFIVDFSFPSFCVQLYSHLFFLFLFCKCCGFFFVPLILFICCCCCCVHISLILRTTLNGNSFCFRCCFFFLLFRFRSTNSLYSKSNWVISKTDHVSFCMHFQPNSFSVNVNVLSMKTIFQLVAQRTKQHQWISKYLARIRKQKREEVHTIAYCRLLSPRCLCFAINSNNNKHNACATHQKKSSIFECFTPKKKKAHRIFNQFVDMGTSSINRKQQ